MCGICAFFYRSEKEISEFEGKLFEDTFSLDRRGPDQRCHMRCSVGGRTSALFYGTLLHFRGHLTPQPLRSIAGNVLLWNGEIFGGIEIDDEENDGQKLLEVLDQSSSDADILTRFSTIEGPWAVIYWQLAQRKLWFGRDAFGRRSLLVHVQPDGAAFGLSSVQLKQFEQWQEVPANGIFCLTLEEKSELNNILQFDKLVLYPWVYAETSRSSRIVSLTEAKMFNETLAFEVFSRLKNVEIKMSDFGIECHVPVLNLSILETSTIANEVLEEVGNTQHELLRWATSEHLQAADNLQEVLSDAVKVRIACQSRCCNGCMKAFLNRTRQKEKQKSDNIKYRDSVDLFQFEKVIEDDLNKCEAAFSCNELSGCDKGSFNKKILSDDHTRNKIPIVSATDYFDDTCDSTVENQTCTMNDASKVHQSTYAVDISHPDVNVECHHAKVAVLFSGGVDSLVLAALADKFVASEEPIDLLNVAFEQRINGRKSSVSGIYDVPDRITGRQGLTELQTINPNRQWNFVEIDVSIEELQKNRVERIKNLVSPLNTVLDDSIGCAIWFAARGQGTLGTDAANRVPYISPARVVLVGMGADEQLGGYSRHRVRFKESGWEGLNEEIQMEIRRISSRNLGRDDRIISDHSREARIPFLDERVVAFLSSLPINLKVNFSLPRGIGEKYLLRLCALRLRLFKGSVLQKRAIQFGSRIAKAENGREKATDQCVRLKQTHCAHEG